MVRLRLIAVLALSLGACDYGPTGDAKRAARADMLDEDSAKFRDVRQCHHNKSIVIGEVNGKNAYGAYSGYKTFLYQGGAAIFDGHPFFKPLTERCFGPEVTAETKRIMDGASAPPR